MVVYVTFLRDVACQKLLNSANVSRSYSQNNTGTVFFETRCIMWHLFLCQWALLSRDSRAYSVTNTLNFPSTRCLLWHLSAPNAFSVAALPRTSMESSRRSPRPHSRMERKIPLLVSKSSDWLWRPPPKWPTVYTVSGGATGALNSAQSNPIPLPFSSLDAYGVSTWAPSPCYTLFSTLTTVQRYMNVYRLIDWLVCLFMIVRLVSRE